MQTGLMAIQVVAQLSQVPVDCRAIIREYSLPDRELAPEELLRILKNTGFKSKLKTISLKKLSGNYPLPAICLLQEGTYGVLLQLNPEKKRALVLVPGQNEPQDLSWEAYDALTTGQVIVLIHKKSISRIKFGFQWFYTEILHYRLIIAEVLVGSFIVQLFGLVTPLFTQVIMDKVIVHHAMTTLDVLAVAFLAIMVFEFLLNVTRNTIFIHTANKIDAKLGAKLFKHLFALPYIYFETRKVGNIVAKVRELENIRDFITNKSVSVLLDLFFALVFLVMMFLYSVKLTFIVLGFITLVGLLYVIITPELRRRLEIKFQMGAQSNAYLVESITGIQTVKSLAIEGAMQRKWEDYLGDYLQSSFKLSGMSTLAQAISGLLQKAMTIAILYLGVKQVIDNHMTIGQLIAFQMFTGQLTSPVLRLMSLWNEFQQTLLAVDRLGDILNHPAEQQSEQAITLPSLQGAIRFDRVSFRYTTDGMTVLEQFNLNIAPGSCIGLVGRSGSGKSTLTKLIQRLYIPQQGGIYIDGLDSRHVNPLWLRSQIGVVLQENYLFSGTIRENIAMPRPDAPIELILHVAQMAGAHEFITQLPEGYDTAVGERGSTLSGGQKQRIAIARALITHPKILIFDEATSALDYESEKIIQNNLHQIKQGRTVIMIAHRLSTVKGCDLIVAMDNGHIVEMGTHHQLLGKKGYYHFLYTHQEFQEPETRVS